VPLRAVQQALQEQFERWGRPQRLRVDNGVPWGNHSDLPPVLVLWLRGLGIGVIWNQPYRPTQNAKVERANGTVSRWGEPQQCADWAAWEEKLAWVVRVQREEYPAIEGQSRQAAYPALAARAGAGAGGGKNGAWELARVGEYLAQGVWPRQVSAAGQISLYGKAYRVGKEHAGEPVWVRFEATGWEWVVYGRDQQQALVRHAADQITGEKITQLQIAKPHASSRPRQRRNLPSSQETIPYAA